jgi:hypothetical protein
MKFTAKAYIKPKIVVDATVKSRINVSIAFPILTASCPQYNLIDGGYPLWNYQPIGSFDLISGGGA